MSLMVVTDHRYAPLFKQWIEERLACVLNDDARYVAQVLQDGERLDIVACAVFNGWRSNAVEISFATEQGARQVMSRPFVQAIFDYAFNFACKYCVYSTVLPDNDKAIKINETVGMKHVGAIPDFDGEGRDILLFSMSKKDWEASRYNRKGRLQ